MLTSREFRLATVAVAGLGLIFLARTGDGSPDAIAAQSPDEAPDVAVVGQEGGAGAVAGEGDSADQLAALGDRSIRLIDFGEVDQMPDLCADGLSEDTLSDIGTIELTGGTSDLLDDEFFSHLDVLGEAYGDLSGDGVDEAVVHTVCGYGASGRQHNVQVWSTGGGVAEPIGMVPAPDPELTGPFPPDVSEISVVDGALEVVWTVYEEGDPNCCPSGTLPLTYELVDGEIVQTG